MVLVWLDLIVRCNWMISGDGHREALGKGSSWGCGVIWTHQDSSPLGTESSAAPRRYD